jgi:hypothetical protein
LDGLGDWWRREVRRKTRSAVAKQSASSATAAVSAVKVAEKKKKRKRKATSPLAVVTPSIPTPRSREVESEEEEEDEAVEGSLVAGDRLARRSESPASMPQRRQICLRRLGCDSLGQSLASRS